MTDKWRDLGPRLISAVVMLAVAIGAAWTGPLAFAVLVSVATGLMLWELTRMHGPRFRFLPEAAAAAAAVLVFIDYPMLLGALWVYPVAASLILAGILTFGVNNNRRLFAPYAMAALLTGTLLAGLFEVSPSSVLVLLAVVIFTDVAGYFAGKSIGGKKFWPTISPKKTWAGVIAGWIAAGGVGVVAAITGSFEVMVIPVAMLMSFASQLGDIAESGLKRRAGVKDSSNMIPGHGGVLDRFDGVVGASLVLLVYMLLKT